MCDCVQVQICIMVILFSGVVWKYVQRAATKTTFSSNPASKTMYSSKLWLICLQDVKEVYDSLLKTFISALLTHQILHQRLVSPPCHTEKKR